MLRKLDKVIAMNEKSKYLAEALGEKHKLAHIKFQFAVAHQRLGYTDRSEDFSSIT